MQTGGKHGGENIKSCLVTVKTLNAQGKQIGTTSTFNANDGSSYTPGPAQNVAGEYVSYLLVNGVKSNDRTITINGPTKIIVQLASYDK
ncbi:MAG: hypothetical protein ACRCYE_16175 [Sarcina sp.]